MDGRLRKTCGALAAAALCAGAAGCRHDREFIWVEQVPYSLAAPEDPNRIAVGDVIGLRVWNQESNSIDRVRVRDDGRVAMPFLGDVEVAGMEPSELARRLEVRLKTYLVNPVVTVVVHERRVLRVSVLGQVTRPGVYDLEAGAGVLHALAAAGGLTPFAHDDRVFVLRSGYWADGAPSSARIRFSYAKLRQGRAPGARFSLRPGDVVVVE